MQKVPFAVLLLRVARERAGLGEHPRNVGAQPSGNAFAKVGANQRHLERKRRLQCCDDAFDASALALIRLNRLQNLVQNFVGPLCVSHLSTPLLKLREQIEP